MSSRSAVLGLQQPRVAVAPSAADYSDADHAAFLSSSYGLTPDEWQFVVLQAWLGRRRDGRWSASTAGASIPRQNGKNALLEIRELFGMVALGEAFLHTAHEVKTARKAFRRLAGFFQDERHYPELAALVSEVRMTNGQEAIILGNGGSCEFVARSKGSGRGFTVDVLVMDEAQELSDEALEALTPTTSAAPLGNPQTIFTGTPPSVLMHGEVFTRIRAAAVDGAARHAWHEWSCVGSVDLDDRENWAAANPALGTRLNLETLIDERSRFTDEGFARERLGMWESDTTALIPSAAWSSLADTTEQPAGHVGSVVLAVDTNQNRSRTCIVAAGLGADGVPLIEVVETRKGVDWAAVALQKLFAAQDVRAIVIDRRSQAATLIETLRSQRFGVQIIDTDTSQFVKACGGFFDAVTETGKLRHLDQPELNSALQSASIRPLGEAWAWNRKSTTGDVTPLIAATLALWGLGATAKAVDTFDYTSMRLR